MQWSRLRATCHRSHSISPGQNRVSWDRAGCIGRFPTGRIPIDNIIKLALICNYLSVLVKISFKHFLWKNSKLRRVHWNFSRCHHSPKLRSSFETFLQKNWYWGHKITITNYLKHPNRIGMIGTVALGKCQTLDEDDDDSLFTFFRGKSF